MKDTRILLENEHEELLELLGEIARKKTEVGHLFSEVLRIFRYHLVKENESVVPLLAYMKDRLGEYKGNEKNFLNLARAKLEDLYPEMISEHNEMGKLIRLAQIKLEEEQDKLASKLAEQLLHHVELEEELLYPAAFASGDLVEYELELLGDKIRY